MLAGRRRESSEAASSLLRQQVQRDAQYAACLFLEMPAAMPFCQARFDSLHEAIPSTDEPMPLPLGEATDQPSEETTTPTDADADAAPSASLPLVSSVPPLSLPSDSDESMSASSSESLPSFAWSPASSASAPPTPDHRATPLATLLAELPPTLRQYAIDLAEYHAAGQPTRVAPVAAAAARPIGLGQSDAAAGSPMAPSGFNEDDQAATRYPRRMLKSPIGAQGAPQTAVPAPAAFAVPALFPVDPRRPHGHHPFLWENAVDDELPFNFVLRETSWTHPSVVVGSMTDDQAAAFIAGCGCSCEDGQCGADCECAKEAEMRYSLDGKVKINAAVPRYSECWSGCTCQKLEDEMQAPADAQHATPDEDVLAETRQRPKSPPHRKNKKRERQTARYFQPVGTAAAVAAAAASPSVGSVRRCFNRVVQRGPVRPGLVLVVFRTSDGRGWGVKSLSHIESGSYVCDYIGERIQEHIVELRGRAYRRAGISNYTWTPWVREGDEVELDEYLPRSQRHRGDDEGRSDDEGEADADAGDEASDASGRRTSDSDDSVLVRANVHNEPYSIDALRVGHLARFINNDHDPNLVMVEVLIERRDKRFVHGALFARKAIRPGDELTFQYGEAGFTCKCATCEKKRTRAQKKAKGQPHGGTTSARKRMRTTNQSPGRPTTPSIAAPAGGKTKASGAPLVRSLQSAMDAAAGATTSRAVAIAPPPSARPAPGVDSASRSHAGPPSDSSSESPDESMDDGAVGLRAVAPPSSSPPVSILPLAAEPTRLSFGGVPLRCVVHPVTSVSDVLSYTITHVVCVDLFALAQYTAGSSNTSLRLKSFALDTEKVRVQPPSGRRVWWTLTASGMRAWFHKRSTDRRLERMPKLREWLQTRVIDKLATAPPAAGMHIERPLVQPRE